jgi:two-component system, NtrC family, sensor kinase
MLLLCAFNYNSCGFIRTLGGNRTFMSGIRLYRTMPTKQLIPSSARGPVRQQIERRSPAPVDPGSLVASVVHEINNPLDSLLSLLYLVEGEATLTVKGRQYLTLAEEEVQRVSQIAHAALEGFRNSAAPKDTDVPKLVNSVIDLYKSRFEGRGISIDTRYRHGRELPVYTGQLRQLFSNLLLNAADAMPGGGRLHARTSAAREWSGQRRHGLRVTLADTGCGISAENMHKIFEPSFTTKGSGGSGLGLSLVRDVVRKHGGSLRVRSSTKPGRSGSIFAIFLPAA